MSIGEAIISTIIIVIVIIVVISAAKTTSITKMADVKPVEIVWQPRMVHNAINNPYIELSDKSIGSDPDAELILSAGKVPFTQTEISDIPEVPEESLEMPSDISIPVEITEEMYDESLAESIEPEIDTTTQSVEISNENSAEQ